jgi:transcriptional regulator with XRE-family HTH domain
MALAKRAPAQFSSLLKSYRERGGLTLQQLSDRTDGRVSASYIAKMERGACNPPSQAALEALSRALELSNQDYMQFTLSTIGMYEPLRGYLPLSPTEVGLDASHFSMIWIVGPVPIEFHNPTLQKALVHNLTDGDTQFVYWLPEEAIQGFDSLVSSLEKRLPAKAKDNLVNRLECIIAPNALCWQQFAIYQPLAMDAEKKKGRIGIRGERGEVAGVLPMNYVEEPCALLREAYSRLRQKREFEFIEYLSGDPKERKRASYLFSKHYPPS